MPEIARRAAAPRPRSPSVWCAPSARSATPASRSRSPRPTQLPDAAGAVLAVLYLIFTEGYTATGGDGLRRDDVAEEAIRLAGSSTG